MTAGETTTALLEELDEVKPAPISSPSLLEANRGSQCLLDRPEFPYLPVHLHGLQGEAGPSQKRSHLTFVVGKAGAPSGFTPLVGVKTHEGEYGLRTKRAARSLHDRVRHAEMSDHQIGREGRVLDGLGVVHHELDVSDASKLCSAPGFSDGRRVAVHPDYPSTSRCQRECQGTPTGSDIQGSRVAKRLACEPGEKSGANR